MARKNRVSVYDGIYHVTTRIANRAMLLAEEGVKNEILGRIVSVARFSGVELPAVEGVPQHQASRSWTTSVWLRVFEPKLRPIAQTGPARFGEIRYSAHRRRNIC